MTRLTANNARSSVRRMAGLIHDDGSIACPEGPHKPAQGIALDLRRSSDDLPLFRSRQGQGLPCAWR